MYQSKTDSRVTCIFWTAVVRVSVISARNLNKNHVMVHSYKYTDVLMCVSIFYKLIKVSEVVSAILMHFFIL